MNYSKSAPQLLIADWIWPGFGKVIKSGAVLIEGEHIAAVLDERSRNEILAASQKGLAVLDCGTSVITPGLFNLHTHLDYTRVTDIPDGLPLFPWLRELVGRSRRLAPEDFQEAAQDGARQAALAGTTYLVDSSFTGSPLAALAKTGLRGLVGLELFGLSDAKAEKIFQFWLGRRQKLLDTADSTTRTALDCGRIKLTVAPHAPYTVGPKLWKMADNWAANNGLMLTAHLAETQAEVDWLGRQSPMVDDYLAWVMPPDPDFPIDRVLESLSWRRPGLTPVEHLSVQGLLNERLLAAHSVHLDPDDLPRLAAAGPALAFCRRSNLRLMGQTPAISKFTDIGKFTDMDKATDIAIKFGLGTDSLASCRDLSPLAEAGAWFRAGLGLDAAQVMTWITSGAAAAVKETDIGSLHKGMRADLAVFPCSASDYDDPLDILLEQAPAALHLLVDGKFVVRNSKVLSDS